MNINELQRTSAYTESPLSATGLNYQWFGLHSHIFLLEPAVRRQHENGKPNILTVSSNFSINSLLYCFAYTPGHQDVLVGLGVASLPVLVTESFGRVVSRTPKNSTKYLICKIRTSST